MVGLDDRGKRRDVEAVGQSRMDPDEMFNSKDGVEANLCAWNDRQMASATL